jgi:hypothetical protein
MKAFIVTVIAPDDWGKTDVLCSMNMGMRDWAKSQTKDLSGIQHSVTIAEEFNLAKPKALSA